MLNIAFKEWNVVDLALGTGEQTILIRKGGIHEKHSRFEVEHDRFLIYPTRLHQSPDMLKEPWRSKCRDDRADPSLVEIRHFVEVKEVFVAPPEDQMARWDAFHIYSPDLIRARYRYKPDRPLHVLLVRAHRLATLQTIVETAAYAGCRSWVTLDNCLEIGATPCLPDEAFSATANRLRLAMRP